MLWRSIMSFQIGVINVRNDMGTHHKRRCSFKRLGRNTAPKTVCGTGERCLTRRNTKQSEHYNSIASCKVWHGARQVSAQLSSSFHEFRVEFSRLHLREINHVSQKMEMECDAPGGFRFSCNHHLFFRSFHPIEDFHLPIRPPWSCSELACVSNKTAHASNNSRYWRSLQLESNLDPTPS